MKKSLIFLFVALFIIQGAFSQQPTCTADSARVWLNFLASDELRGRANGSDEIEKVAQWLSEKFKQFGLQPVAGMKDFVQPYIFNKDSSFIHKNIIGYLPAKNEQGNENPFIVISAHFDHIGISHFPVNGDSIYNGADDNASGVIAMLAIAKNLSNQQLQTNNPILFVAFSNEEEGLLGSRYFVNSNVVPIEQIKLNINLEMLGRSHEFGRNKFLITGTQHSNFQDIVVEFNKETEWGVADAGEIVNFLFRMSDNYSFVEYAQQHNFCIPAHTIVTSLGFEHIHQVDDEVEYIDFENLNNLIEHLTQLILYLSNNKIVVQCN
ncbi:MAG: M20/M25/M40 family metallo-hydrolase [Dysgonamonadaceae bacterium]|jgi:hypothetical protein|nr:M20/M25/M40 family metallo-hydrolase [Dysgonamonadaceae bacterium]